MKTTTILSRPSTRFLALALSIFCIGAFTAPALLAADATLVAQITALHSADLQAKKNQSAALRAFISKTAATPGSAERFFYDGVKNLDFNKTSKDSGNYRAWKSEFDRQFPAGQLGKTVQFQLRFLWLSLASAEQAGDMELTRLWLAYLRDLAAHAPALKVAIPILSQSIAESVVGRVLKPETIWGESIQRVTPAQVETIFDQHLLSRCPAASKAAAYDEVIRWLDAIGKAWFTPEEYASFQKIELVRLQWRKLSELALLDGRINAAEARALVAFLRQNKDHPASLSWIEFLKQPGSAVAAN